MLFGLCVLVAGFLLVSLIGYLMGGESKPATHQPGLCPRCGRWCDDRDVPCRWCHPAADPSTRPETDKPDATAPLELIAADATAFRRHLKRLNEAGLIDTATCTKLRTQGEAYLDQLQQARSTPKPAHAAPAPIAPELPVVAEVVKPKPPEPVVQPAPTPAPPSIPTAPPVKPIPPKPMALPASFHKVEPAAASKPVPIAPPPERSCRLRLANRGWTGWSRCLKSGISRSRSWWACWWAAC